VVLVNGDTVDEEQETFFLDISNVQNATVGSSRGTGFIVDDDGPSISVNDVTVTEGNSGYESRPPLR
jgi:serralysin